MQQEAQYHQLDFFDLLPGSAGGRALRALKGNSYFSDLARNAAAKRTKQEKQAIRQKGAEERRRRLYTTPRTEVSDWRVFDMVYRITERVIPYWPRWSTKRRQRPVFVRIELECIQFVETHEHDGLG